jgi:hypothetical protein
MTNLVGADVAGLRDLATAFDERAEALRESRQQIDAAVGSAQWMGPDAQAFSQAWISSLSVAMAACEVSLESAADQARRNADAQENASQADESGPAPVMAGPGGAPVLAAGAPTGTVPPAAQDFLQGLDDMTPAQVNAAWAGLDQATRDWLIHNKPVRIGNLDGVPFTDRDAANRREMNRLLDTYDRAIADAREQSPWRPESDRWPEVAFQDAAFEASGLDPESLAALRNLRRELGEHPDGQLAALDVAHEGAVRAAFSIGNLDTATNIGVYVPGISSRISSGEFSQPEDNGRLDSLDKMEAIRDRAGDILKDSHAGGRKDVAQVYWLDYSAPAGAPLNLDLWRAGTSLRTNRAEEGGVNLAGFGDGLDAVNGGARTTVMAHSYGSVTAGFGLTHTSAYDSFVAFGSPGLYADNILGKTPPGGGERTGGIQIPESERWFGHAEEDYIADSRAHGGTPGEWHFNRLPTDAVDGYDASVGHSEYIDPGTSFQQSLAAILAGHPERVPGR